MPRDRKDIEKALTSKGFELEQGSRDHDFLFFWHEGKKQSVYTKLSRGTNYKSIGDPLLAKMSRQLNLSRKEFNQLVDCTLSQAQYTERLIEQHVLPKQAKKEAGQA